MADGTVKTKFDFSDVDIASLDPDTMNIGAGVSDCAVIAQAFERGAVTVPSEAAIFATMSRNLQNNKAIVGTMIDNMTSYLKGPVEAASATAEQANKFGADYTGGISGQNDMGMQSLDMGTTDYATMGDNLGKTMMSNLTKCIPCGMRLSSLIEMRPNIDLLGVFKQYLKNLMGMLDKSLELLTNVDTYGDFCALLSSLSFMCIPDLQRIIVALMALFMGQMPQMQNLFAFIQSLIAPLFTPILMAVTSLLDQLIALVMSPLTCVITVLNGQIKNNASSIPYALTPSKVTPAMGGLQQLSTQLQAAVAMTQRKMAFYTSQVKSMLGDLGAADTASLQAKANLLQIVRLISFVKAIILALSKGQSACSTDGSDPSKDQLDNFFNNFLGNNPFDIWVDDNGQLHVDEKIPNRDETLPPDQNVIQSEGEPVIDPDLVPIVEKITSGLAAPLRAAIPCKLEASVEDVVKMNQWMEELNSL